MHPLDAEDYLPADKVAWLKSNNLKQNVDYKFTIYATKKCSMFGDITVVLKYVIDFGHNRDLAVLYKLKWE